MPEDCQNGIDDNCNYLIDTADPDCLLPGCGDGYCDQGIEDPGNCSIDCYCGNGTCEVNHGEDPGWCPEDCAGGGDCCTPTPGQPGCSDPQIEACVCSNDPYCCDIWNKERLSQKQETL